MILDHLIPSTLEFLSYGYLFAEFELGLLVFLQDVAVLDSIEAMLGQALSPHTLQPLDHNLLANEVFAGTGRQTTRLPLLKLLSRPLCPGNLACMPQSQEYSLLEGKLSDEVAHIVIPCTLLFGFDKCEPANEREALLSSLVASEDRIQSLLLILSEFDEIPPSAKFVAEVEILRTSANLAKLDDGVIFRLKDLLSSDVSCPPFIEEAYFPSLGYIIVNKIELFEIFMSEIHGVAVPQTKEPSLSLSMLI